MFLGFFKHVTIFFFLVFTSVMSSKISSHLQDVVGCVCVNPGRLTKGQVGGTYGRLLIQRSPQSEDGKRVSPCLTAQVVKI